MTQNYSWSRLSIQEIARKIEQAESTVSVKVAPIASPTVR